MIEHEIVPKTLNEILLINRIEELKYYKIGHRIDSTPTIDTSQHTIQLYSADDINMLDNGRDFEITYRTYAGDNSLGYRHFVNK